VNGLPLPPPEPIALPGPPRLLEGLLVFGWFLHALPMNLALGGPWLVLASQAAGRDDLSRSLARLMPPVVALAITFGIVPLLFDQVLYGRAFYSATILLGFPWLSVVFVLMGGYASSYALALRARRPWARAILALLAGLAFSWIAFVFTNVASLTQRPDLWRGLYRATVGWALATADPAVWPRFWHMWAAAVASAGAAVAGLGRWRDDTATTRFGAAWALAGLLAEGITGPLFLAMLPAAAQRAVAGPLLWFGVALALAAALAFAVALGRPASPAAWTGTVLLLPVVAEMTWNREVVRRALLDPSLAPLAQPYIFRTGAFALFVGGFLVAAAIIVWVLLTAARAAFGGRRAHEAP
jgi:hypothetical protein